MQKCKRVGSGVERVGSGVERCGVSLFTLRARDICVSKKAEEGRGGKKIETSKKEV